MSSTYAHYQGSSSLPSDYAILSRPSTSYQPTTILEPHPENTLQISRRITRRESFPAEHYYKPLNPTIGVYPRVDEALQHMTRSPTETSPLLPVPRIEENINCNASADNASKITMFWEELAILTKYALPVFGYDSPSFFLHFSHSNFSQNSSS
jgi:multidrug resistance protein, MATE family